MHSNAQSMHSTLMPDHMSSHSAHMISYWFQSQSAFSKILNSTSNLRQWHSDIQTETINGLYRVVIRNVVTRKCDLHPGSPIQTSTDGIAGCSMRDDVCQVMPDVPIYFLKRKVLWENVLGWL